MGEVQRVKGFTAEIFTIENLHEESLAAVVPQICDCGRIGRFANSNRAQRWVSKIPGLARLAAPLLGLLRDFNFQVQ